MTLLILGGTSNGRILAERVADAKWPAILSLAGATRDPAKTALPVVTGGFGGSDGFLTFLKTNSVKAVVDATHPFASRITDRTSRLCRSVGLPYLLVVRPEWAPVPGDSWIMIEQEADAVQHVPMGQTVFLGTGRQTLDAFANLEGRRVICRQIDPPDRPFPFPGGEYLVGRPPFSVEEEVALFKRLGVDVLVVKNAGGAASYSKLEAARALGLPVLMLRRPPVPDGPKVETVKEAMEWIKTQI